MNKNIDFAVEYVILSEEIASVHKKNIGDIVKGRSEFPSIKSMIEYFTEPNGYKLIRYELPSCIKLNNVGNKASLIDGTIPTTVVLKHPFGKNKIFRTELMRLWNLVNYVVDDDKYLDLGIRDRFFYIDDVIYMKYMTNCRNDLGDMVTINSEIVNINLNIDTIDYNQQYYNSVEYYFRKWINKMLNTNKISHVDISSNELLNKDANNCKNPSVKKIYSHE